LYLRGIKISKRKEEHKIRYAIEVVNDSLIAGIKLNANKPTSGINISSLVFFLKNKDRGASNKLKV